MNSMNAFHEKLFFGVIVGIAAATSALGGILTQDETRFIFVTFAASFFTAGFLALICKRPDETIRVAAGRYGFSVLFGVLGTHPVIQKLGLESTERDAIALAFVSSLVSVFTYFIGHGLIQILNQRSGDIAELLFGWAFKSLKKKTNGK